MTRNISNESSCSPAKRARLTTTSREREYASTNQSRRNGTSFMDSWDGPSSSGLQLHEAVNQWEDDVVKIKILFPTLEEEVLKSYLEIYDIEECIEVVSNLVRGYEDGLDDLGILNDTSTYHPENDNSLTTNTANAKKEKEETKPSSEKRKAEDAPSYEDILARISEVKSSGGKTKMNSSRVKTSITSHSNPRCVSSACTPSRNKSSKSMPKTPRSSNLTKPSYPSTAEKNPVKRKGTVRNLSFSSSSSSHADKSGPVPHVVTSEAKQTSRQIAKHDPKSTQSITKDSFTAALEKAISPPKTRCTSRSDSTAPVSICWEDLTFPKHKDLKCNATIAISSTIQNTSTNNTSNSVSSPSAAGLSPREVLTAQPRQAIAAAIARQRIQKLHVLTQTQHPDQKNTNHAIKSSLSTGISISPAQQTMLPNKTVKTPTKKTVSVSKGLTVEPEKKVNLSSSGNQCLGSDVKYKRLQYFTDTDQHSVSTKVPTNSIPVVTTKASKAVTPKATCKCNTNDSVGIDIRCGKNKRYPLKKSYDKEIAKPYIPHTSNRTPPTKSSSSPVSTSVARTSSSSSSVTSSIQGPFTIKVLSNQSHTNPTAAASKHGTASRSAQNRQGSSPAPNPLSNQNNQSSFLSSFTEGIQDMNNQLQSMLTSVMAKNDRLSTLCQKYSGTPSPSTPSPGTPTHGTSTHGTPAHGTSTPGTPGMPMRGMARPETSSSSDLSNDDERARQEMLSLQKETEVLSKLFPEFDPNYIFFELEQHKDDPSRVTKVNEALLKRKGKNERSRRRSNSWLWFDEKTKKLNSFTDGESNCIEMHYNKGNSANNNAWFAFKGSRRMLSFDFKNMTMKDTVTNRIVKIKRVDSALPAKSSQTSNQNLDEKCLVEVFPGTSEFARVETKLRKSLPHAHVVKIEKVNNSLLQRKYYMHYDLLKQKNGEANVNDKELFHGTRDTKPSEIWNSEAGFDMRYSAQGLWGKGCYFAVHAAYSHAYSHVTRGENGGRVHQMFLAYVLTGDAANLPSDKNIIKPPYNDVTRREYDSVTGVTFGHQIYVLYNNAMSYPAYLITYIVPQ